MTTDLLPKTGLILCAVSGGADSMYLLCRLAEMGHVVAAAHYNHGLRGAEADRDEVFTAGLCRARDIPFYAGRGNVAAFAAENGMGMEEAARTLRYDFLERLADELQAAAIATAHTADDNAETVLLNLTRGTGLHGLCGIPPVRGRVIRPILDTTRQEILSWLGTRDIPYVTDSSNDTDAYARNRIRHHVIPALTAEDPAFLRAVGRMTELLRADDEYLETLAASAVEASGGENTISAQALLSLPEPIALRAVRHMAGRGITAGQARAILDVARNGGVTDVTGMRVGRSGDKLVFGIEPMPALDALTLAPGTAADIPGVGLRVRCEKLDKCPPYVHKSFNTFYFKYANICGSITITARRPGDSIRPAGRGCTKTLKALFMEGGIPAWRRDAVPVLRDEAGPLGVYGLAAAERACARPGDENVLKIEFAPAAPGEGSCGDASGY